VSLQAPGLHCSELDTPKPDGLAAYCAAVLNEHILDVSVAEIELFVQPECIADDPGWESTTVASIQTPALAIRAN
jgi:hypothetical protein